MMYSVGKSTAQSGQLSWRQMVYDVDWERKARVGGGSWIRARRTIVNGCCSTWHSAKKQKTFAFDSPARAAN